MKPTLAELEAEIARLNQQLEALKPKQELSAGQVIPLSVGLATIKKITTEGAINKVQMLLQPVAPEDGKTPVGDGALCTMPIATFRKYQVEFDKNQIERALAARRTKAG